MKSRPACFTAPIPRKNLNMGPARQRPVMLDQVSTERRVKDNEINERYKIVEDNSGILTVGGVLYKDVKIEQLVRHDDLGSGTCGTVYKYSLDGKVMAVKEMKRTDNKEEAKRIFMDLHVIRKSNNCPYIVKCFGYIITRDHLFIAMELMASCAEKLLIARNYVGFPEEIIAKISCSVIKALNYLKEEHSLMHRDVKPSNILLNIRGQIKLCDFGISGQLIDSIASTTSAGCTAYLAPERINQHPYDVRADVWSLGISLVQLARGRSPYAENQFKEATPFSVMVEIQKGEPPKIYEADGFSVDFCEFVADCLQYEIAKRPKYQKLMEMPFFMDAESGERSKTDVADWLARPEVYYPPGPPQVSID